MLMTANGLSEAAVVSWPDEATAGAFLGKLQDHGGKALIFVYGGRALSPGYHVTEVKAAQFGSLDCGANPEAWRETIIQLWDVEEPGRTFMPVAKFLAIMWKVAEQVPFDQTARLTFEVSDSTRAMQIFGLGEISVDDEAVRASLEPRPASCKPRDRWLDQQTAAQNCCGPKTHPS
jgi:hypothetical protein